VNGATYTYTAGLTVNANKGVVLLYCSFVDNRGEVRVHYIHTRTRENAPSVITFREPSIPEMSPTESYAENASGIQTFERFAL